MSGNDGLKLGNGYTLVLAVAAPEDSDADAGGAASVAARVKISATFELGAEPSGACPPGHFSARGAWPQCTPCLKGTFPDSRHVACWPCPYGLTTAGAGATSFVECNLKPDDPLARYSTVSLAVHMRMHVCVRGRGEREIEREREREKERTDDPFTSPFFSNPSRCCCFFFFRGGRREVSVDICVACLVC